MLHERNLKPDASLDVKAVTNPLMKLQDKNENFFEQRQKLNTQAGARHNSLCMTQADPFVSMGQLVDNSKTFDSLRTSLISETSQEPKPAKNLMQKIKKHRVLMEDK